MWTWLRWFRKQSSCNSKQRMRPHRAALRIEVLEARLAPAFDLTIGAAPSVGVHFDTTGTISATAHGAHLAVSDILSTINYFGSAHISDGSTGNEAGNVTWLAGNDLDFKGILRAGGKDGDMLTVATDPSATVGNVILNSKIFDSAGSTADALAVSLGASGNLQVNGNILSGRAPITLAADVNANGTGNDGAGTLSIGPGVTVSGGAVTLRGAAVHIDTSSNPATVTAANPVSTFATGFNGPLGLAFDAQGNLYVGNDGDGTVSKVTPQGQVSTFASGFTNPDSLAVDAQGNLYVGNDGAGTVSKVTPQGQVSTFASGFNDPWGLAFDAQGDLYVANLTTGTVSKVTSQGQVSTYASGFNFPNGLVFDAQGNLYVLNNGNGTVSKVTPRGVVTSFASGFSNPYAMAMDTLGNLFVADANNQTISKVLSGGIVATVVSGLNDPIGLAIDTQENIYVGDANNTVSRVAQGTVTVRSSLSTRPISIGNGSAVNTVNLSNAELAHVTAPGGFTLGDSSQTGAITFTDAVRAGGAVSVQQAPGGPGQIVLNDGGGAAPALSAGNAVVALLAGTGGIVAASASNATAEIATIGTVSLDTTGTIGSASNRIQFAVAAPNQIIVGDGVQPASVYLDGLGDLTLGSIHGGDAGTTLDVTARGNLTVAAGSVIATGAGAISLAADVQPGGSGDNGVGTLSVMAGATVTGGNVTLRGADVAIDTSSNPATVTAPGGVSSVATGLSTPQGLAFDAQGNLYVVNEEGGTVTKITPQGAASTFASGFFVPIALAFDSQGNLYVGDAETNSVSKVTPQGQISTVASVPNFPAALAFDAHGNLFVVGYNAGTVSEITPQNVLTTLPYTFSTPSGLAFDAQGNLYVASHNAGTVSKITPQGMLSTLAVTFQGPTALAFDARGNLFVINSGNDTVSKVTSQGVASTFAKGFKGAAGLALDAHGNLFVSNSDTCTVNKVTPQGVVTVVPTGLGFPSSLAFDAQGNLYVANFSAGTVSKVTPQGTLSTFAGGFSGPDGLAFDAQGDLYVANGKGTTVSKVTPLGTVSTFLSGLDFPSGLAFDHLGDLFVLNGDGTLKKVTAQGKVSTFASGINASVLAIDAQGNLYTGNGDNTVSKITPQGAISTLPLSILVPFGLAFDSQGNLYVAGGFYGTVTKMTPQGTTSTFISGISGPDALAIAQGNLYIASGFVGTVSKIGLGSVTIRSSLPSRPMGVGDGASAVNGINLSNAELARIQPAGPLILGDSAQTGTISLNTATFSSDVRVQQSSAGAGQIVLNDGQSGTGLDDPAGTVRLSPGLDGIQEINIGAGTTDVVARVLQLNSPVSIGSVAQPLNVQVSFLNDSTIKGNLFLNDSADLTTAAPITVSGSVSLGLNGNFTTHARALPAATVLTFTSPTTQTFDSGGQTFASLNHTGFGLLQLVSHGLTLSGNLVNAGGDFDSNNLPVMVGGVTHLNNGIFRAGSAALAFQGGLTLGGGTFRGAAGTVSAAGIDLLAGSFYAPVMLHDSGNWVNSGVFFQAGDGTVDFNGSGLQTLDSGNVQPFANLTHSGNGTLRLINLPLTVAGNFENTAGIFDSNNLAVTIDGTTTLPGGTFLAGTAALNFMSGLTLNGGNFTGATGTVTAGGVSIVAGTLLAPALLSDSGNWSISHGIFTANHGTVALTGTNQHVNGSTTFFIFSKVVGTTDTLTFQAGSTQTVLGTLTLEGTAGNLLLLRSSTPGQQWTLTPGGQRIVYFVDVQDSHNGSQTPIMASSPVNSGNNSGWVFP